jgi:Carboxypeptidase regulatory-like domain
MRKYSKLIILSFFALALSSITLAQGTTSRLTGTVKDNNGAVVAGANVTLTNEGTSISITTQTSENGSYTFDLIQVGNYSVTIEKSGFKKFVTTKNAVNVNVPTTINVSLQAGEVSATVTVESSAEAVQTSSSGNIGVTIEQRTVESLPVVGLRGRNPLDLLNYQPGFVTGANTGGGNHVNGSRDRAFNFTLDGIDINESSAGGSNFTPLRPNPDSIQEFQVVTSNFTAELGRSSGAQVTFVTKSGTNKLRGNAFEYYQTPRFNANEYENNLNLRPKNQFVQHIFGGSLGGPIIKNKLFYFANVQLLRAYETRLVTRTVYTSTARTGLFRYNQGGINSPVGTNNAAVNSAGNAILPPCSATVTTLCINSYNIAGAGVGIGTGNTAVGTALPDPALLAIINRQPLPNNFSVGDGLNTAGFNFAAPQREKQYDFVTKFDYKLNDNNLFYVRYAQGQQDTIGDSANTGLRIFPDTNDLVTTFRAPKNLAVNYRWSPTAKFTNEFIFGWSKFRFDFENPNPDPAGFFSFNLITNPVSNFTYNARGVRVFQFVDNVTFDFSPHIVKAGINFRRGQQVDDRSSVAGSDITLAVSLAPNGNNNNYQIFGLQNPLTGINANDLTRVRNMLNDLLGRVGTRRLAFVSDASGSNAFAPAGTRWEFEANYGEYDFYIQDNWKVKSNLSFDLGLRWEAKLTPTSNGRPILAPTTQVTFGTAPSNTLSFAEGELFKNDYNNFSPSIGFAWDPTKSGKNSIRANYRLNYDRFPTQLFAANIFQNAPGNTFGAADVVFGGNSPTTVGGLLRDIGSAAPLVPTRLPSADRTPLPFGQNAITILDKDLKFPEVHSWSVSYQREIIGGMVLEANYIGKRGTNLFGGYDANQVNLNATDSRCGGETFLQAFQSVQGGSTNSCLLNFLMAGNNATNAGTTSFRTTFVTQLLQNNIGSVAQNLSQRTTNPITGFGFSPFFFQKYPQFTGGLNVLDTNDVSKYHGFELILKQRIKNGLGFQVSYTLSKSKDTRSFDPTFTTVSRANNQSASSTPFDNFNRQNNFAWSDFDRRHAFQGTFVYELPFGKGKFIGGDIPKALDFIIGGWQLAGGFNVASGRPFTVFSGVNTFGNVVQSTADCNGCRRNLGQLVQESGTNFLFNADARSKFSRPAAGSNGNTGRNFFLGSPQRVIDVSLSKKFRFTERLNFDLRVDAKNLTNSPSFGLPTATFDTPTFGRIRDGVTSSSRRIQISGKFNF